MHFAHKKAIQESTKRECFSCRAGGVQGTPVDWMVSGYDANGEYFRGYVCADHLEKLIQDAIEIRAVSAVSPAAWKIQAERLWKQYESRRAGQGPYERSLDTKLKRLRKEYWRAQDRAGLND